MFKDWLESPLDLGSDNPVVWANKESPIIILNVRCNSGVCGVAKSPLLKGSAMLALLGTLENLVQLTPVVPSPM